MISEREKQTDRVGETETHTDTHIDKHRQTESN